MNWFLLYWVLPSLIGFLICAQVLRHQWPFTTSDYYRKKPSPCDWTEGEMLTVFLLSVIWPFGVVFIILLVSLAIWELLVDTHWTRKYIWEPLKELLCKKVF